MSGQIRSTLLKRASNCCLMLNKQDTYIVKFSKTRFLSYLAIFSIPPPLSASLYSLTRQSKRARRQPKIYTLWNKRKRGLVGLESGKGWFYSRRVVILPVATLLRTFGRERRAFFSNRYSICRSAFRIPGNFLYHPVEGNL